VPRGLGDVLPAGDSLSAGDLVVADGVVVAGEIPPAGGEPAEAAPLVAAEETPVVVRETPAPISAPGLTP